MVWVIHHTTEVIIRFDHGLRKAFVVSCKCCKHLTCDESTAQFNEILIALEKKIIISLSKYQSISMSPDQGIYFYFFWCGVFF